MIGYEYVVLLELANIQEHWSKMKVLNDVLAKLFVTVIGACFAGIVCSGAIKLATYMFGYSRYDFRTGFGWIFVFIIIIGAAATVFGLCRAVYFALKMKVPIADVYEAIAIHGLRFSSEDLTFFTKKMFYARLRAARIYNDAQRDARVRLRP